MTGAASPLSTSPKKQRDWQGPACFMCDLGTLGVSLQLLRDQSDLGVDHDAS